MLRVLLLLAGCMTQAATPETVATWKGGTLTQAEVDASLAETSRSDGNYLLDRYAQSYASVERLINNHILGLEAQRRGLASVDALLQQEVQNKNNDTSTENQRYAAYIQKLRSDYGVQLNLPEPEATRLMVSVDDDPSIGPSNAPITIVEFADYQCPFCGRADRTIKDVIQKYNGQVRFVYRDYPLAFHARARPAAIAANCAIPQGKFWPMHDAMMANQTALSDADLSRVAQKVGLNVRQWSDCLKDPAVDAEIERDMAEATTLGVTGTPIFFINGLSLTGAQPLERFTTLIDQELKKR